MGTMINFQDESDAIALLEKYDILISDEYEILYPKGQEFNNNVDEAINYLLNEWDFGFKFVEYA